MKNKFAKLLAICSCLSIVGCGGASEDSNESIDMSGEITEDVTISFFGWGSQEEQSNFQDLIDEFMRQEPHIKVVYSACDSSSYMNTLKNKANSLPDVFYMPDYEFMSWADSGRLLALDDYCEQSELDAMWDLAVSMNRYDKDSYTLGEGKLYGLPKDLGPYTLVYNKDLLKRCMQENGNWVSEEESYPDPLNPVSWDEFVNYLGKMKTDSVYPIGYYELMTAVYSNNANFFSDDMQEERISTKEFAQAVQFIADLTANGLAPTANQQSEQNSFQRWLNQGCIFTFMGPWDCATFWKDVNFDYDIVPVPYGPADGATSTTWVGSVSISVSNKSQHKKAAVKLAKFLTCSETASEMNYKLGQAVPNVVSYAENQYLRGDGLTELQLKSPSNRQLFLDIIRGNDETKVYGKNRAKYYLYENTCYDDLESSLEPVYKGQKTAEEFLRDYASTFQSQLDDSNANIN